MQFQLREFDFRMIERDLAVRADGRLDGKWVVSLHIVHLGVSVCGGGRVRFAYGDKCQNGCNCGNCLFHGESISNG